MLFAAEDVVEPVDLRIFDLSGKLHWAFDRLPLLDGQVRLDVGALENGLYLVEIRAGRKKIRAEAKYRQIGSVSFP